MTETPAPLVEAHPTLSFSERYERALANPRLHRNLTTFQQAWRRSRNDAFQDVDFTGNRAKLKAAKTAVVSNLDHYLWQFEQAATRAGATVHFAADAEAVGRAGT